MTLPITKKAHAKTSATKSPICPTCKMPIGKVGSCSCSYMHVRGEK